MRAKKVRVDPALFDRLAQVAEAAGYSSAEEFIQHLLEKAVRDVEDAESEEAVRERLKGLGYIE